LPLLKKCSTSYQIVATTLLFVEAYASHQQHIA